jgi:hypothetical protein
VSTWFYEPIAKKDFAKIANIQGGKKQKWRFISEPRNTLAARQTKQKY